MSAIRPDAFPAELFSGRAAGPAPQAADPARQAQAAFFRAALAQPSLGQPSPAQSSPAQPPLVQPAPARTTGLEPLAQTAVSAQAAAQDAARPARPGALLDIRV